MWPTDDSTTNSSPREPAIVFAFAGDSTITSFISRASLALPVFFAILAPGDTSSQALDRLLADRPPFVAGSQARLPLPRLRARAPAGRRRLRDRGRARVES